MANENQITFDFLLEKCAELLYQELLNRNEIPSNIGPHIYFNKIEKFRNVRKWYERAIGVEELDDGDDKYKNIIRIFTKGSKTGTLDYQIRSLFNNEDFIKETNQQLINSNKQRGSFTELLKQANKDVEVELDSANLKQLKKYIDEFIKKMKASYVKDNNTYSLKVDDKGSRKEILFDKTSSVGKELEYLLNFYQDSIPLVNGCYFNALGIIKEVKDKNFSYNLSQKEEDDDLVNEILKYSYGEIDPNGGTIFDKIKEKHEIPKYYLVDQLFNCLDKIKKADLQKINSVYTNSDDKIVKDFYQTLYDFVIQSKYYRDKYDFINTLTTNKNTILTGPPGTGKTFQVMESLKELPEDEMNNYEMVVFHANYTYDDFIDGIKPVGIENGQLKLSLVNGKFKDFCIKVHNRNKEIIEKVKVAIETNREITEKEKEINEVDKETIERNRKFIEKNDKVLPSYYFIVDEINRANLSAVFGESLMLLESSYRYEYFPEGIENGIPLVEYNRKRNRLISLQNSNIIKALNEEERKNKYLEELNGEYLFGIPENIYFIGMMNDVDKSIDAFDLALRRRFSWIEKSYDKNVVKGVLSDFNNIDEYLKNIEELNKYISTTSISKPEGLGLGKQYEFGHSFFLKIEDFITQKKIITEDAMKNLFDIHLKPTLREYLRTVYSDSEIEKYLKIAKEEKFLGKTNTKSGNKDAETVQ